MKALTKALSLRLAPFAAALVALAASGLPAAARDGHEGGAYLVTNLVSDLPGVAAVTDPDLVNPWGISFSPTGPFWLSDNGTGLSTLYNGVGAKQPLIVTIPPPVGSADGGTPTGQVFNPTPDFVVSQGVKHGKSAFLFASEDGTISGWSPAVNFLHALVAVDNSASGAVYKGLALDRVGTANFLYAANFRAGRIDVFDKNFHPAVLAGAFQDKRIPAGYAPFNVQNVAGFLVVTYAKQDAAKHDDVAGAGHGFVDVYSSSGLLLTRLASRGPLDSPWGVALAPAGFGRFSHALLVGNFGDGRINAYDTRDGDYLGALRGPRERPVVIDGLWGLSFGNGGAAGDTNKLYFTAGSGHEQHGLFGSIQAASENDDD